MPRLSKRNLELATQQFIGYRHGQGGHSIESLAQGMGLTAAEWDALRSEVSLSDADKSSLDSYFNRK